MRKTCHFIGLTIITAILSGPAFGQHQVAITIDDLPRGGDSAGSPEADRAMTAKLLKPFATKHIPLTGFVNECHRTSELLPLLDLWVNAGADMGNHTCSHLDLTSTPPAEFEADLIKGEKVTSELLGHRPTYFRYPFLHTGKTTDVKNALEAFLKQRGYKIAPVTLDDEDYVFAHVYADYLHQGKQDDAQRLLSTYIEYMDSIYAFFETWGKEVTGHDVKQILLIHASQLNADAMPELLAMMKKRGYKFIALTDALTDSAYQLPDNYAGPMGISSIHRWAMAKGLKVKWEPESPAWVMAAYKKSTAR